MEALLHQAEAADQADLPDGLDIPEELARREERLAAIARAKAEIEHRAANRQAEASPLQGATHRAQRQGGKNGQEGGWQTTQAA